MLHNVKEFNFCSARCLKSFQSIKNAFGFISFLSNENPNLRSDFWETAVRLWVLIARSQVLVKEMALIEFRYDTNRLGITWNFFAKTIGHPSSIAGRDWNRSRRLLRRKAIDDRCRGLWGDDNGSSFSEEALKGLVLCLPQLVTL